MALDTINIDTRVVDNVIEQGSDDFKTLCTSSNINKWSKYKPIRDAGFGVNWPMDSMGHYGFGSLPTANVSNINNEDWIYAQPRGGSFGGTIDEPYRIGDFRRYNHLAPPIMYLDQVQVDEVDFDTDDYAKFHLIISSTSDGLKLSDFVSPDYSTWWFGIRLSFGDGKYAYITADDSVNCDGGGDVGLWVLINMNNIVKFGASKSFTWTPFLCESQIALVSTYEAVLPYEIGQLQTLMFPTVDEYPISGTFDIWTPESISVSVDATTPLTVSNTSTSHIMERSTLLNLVFTPNNLDTTQVDYVIRYRSVVVGTGRISGCANGVSKSVTLSVDTPAAVSDLVGVTLTNV
jgi:hypothetical protein